MKSAAVSGSAMLFTPTKRSMHAMKTTRRRGGVASRGDFDANRGGDNRDQRDKSESRYRGSRT